MREVEVLTTGAGGKFDPSRCGGHKNSENAATFSEFLGQEDKLSPHSRVSNAGHNKQQSTGARAVFASRPEIRKMLSYFHGFNALRIPEF